MSHINIPNGLYTLREGDNAQKVAEFVYGDVHRSARLLEANAGKDWEPGTTIKVPGKPGRATLVKHDESIQETIKRLYPEQPVHLFVSLYVAWNGGANALPQEHDLAYLPDR